MNESERLDKAVGHMVQSAMNECDALLLNNTQRRELLSLFVEIHRRAADEIEAIAGKLNAN